MRNINQASELLNTLLLQADKKSEKKVYGCYIRTVSSLNNKDVTQDQIQVIQEKLASLDLNIVPENRKEYYKQHLSEFKAILKNEFSFSSAKYYTEIWMVYGMLFGSGLGMSIGTAIGAGLGTSIGLSIGIGVGMVLGMTYGARKDAEAKRQGRVI